MRSKLRASERGGTGESTSLSFRETGEEGGEGEQGKLGPCILLIEVKVRRGERGIWNRDIRAHHGEGNYARKEEENRLK